MGIAETDPPRREMWVLQSIQVRDVMTNLVLTVRPDDQIEQVAKRLLASRISGAPVVEGGRLVGIVSETDLVSAYWIARRAASRFASSDGLGSTSPVRDVMTKRVVAIKPEANIWEAASLIDRHGIRRLPVVDEDGFVVGVVARADLVRCMAQGQGSTDGVPP